MTADPIRAQLTAYLDDAQKRYQVFGESDAMPRLLAAVEAVLELAAKLEHLETVPPSGKEDEAAALGLRWCATRVREAISAALLGGEPGG